MRARHRTWPVLVMGFGLLIALIAFLGLSAFRDASRIRSEMRSIRSAARQGAGVLAAIQSKTLESAILVRDYLVSSESLPPEQARLELREIRSAVDADLVKLRNPRRTGGTDSIDELSRELDQYWGSLEQILAWTGTQGRGQRATFLRQEVVPRRLAVLSLAQRVGQLSEENLRKESERMEESRAEHLHAVRRNLVLALLLAFSVACFSIARTSHLERHSMRERERAEDAEEELRKLSHKLLHAQEEERKSISRELHDEIGQKLTALRLSIGRLDRLRSGADADYQAQVAESKDLAENALRTARDLAMGLRPSMLDDLGLGPALEWQAREFSRHSGVPACVEISGKLEQIPEAVRTCAYRVAQEALTNCARHAHASSVQILVQAERNRLRLEIRDDGVGMPRERGPGCGLGLIGIDERVRELGGRVSLGSVQGKGSVVAAEIPLSKEVRG
ncbi:MAG: MCP four helix bundle domain-containing protein [Deltaproteobacteria bacterium]|nr:MCP four helix bundle domain-containing protein [Deltaproteobacteria bacterium]